MSNQRLLNEGVDLSDVIKLNDNTPHKLFDYQIYHTGHLLHLLLSGNHSVIDASDTGTGKTIVWTKIMYILKEYGYNFVVVCPKSLINKWTIETESFSDSVLFITNYEQFIRGQYLTRVKKTKHTIVDYGERPNKKNKDKVVRFPIYGDVEYYTNEVTQSKYVELIKGVKGGKYWNFKNVGAKTLFIFDEAHRLKNISSQIFKCVSQLISSTACKLAFLSATIGEDPTKLGLIAKACGLYVGDWKFKAWAMKYGCKDIFVCRKKNGGVQKALKFVGNNSDITRLHNVLFPGFGSRMRIKDIPQFPETVIEPLLITIDNSYCSEAEEHVKEINDKIEELKDFGYVRQEFNLMMDIYCAQLTELLKLQNMYDLIDDHIENGESVVIFVKFIHTLRCLLKHYSNAKEYSGENVHERSINLDMFQKNVINILVCTLDAGGVGIDMHDEYGGHPRFSLFTPNNSAQLLKQGLGRTHRSTAKSVSYQVILYCKDTVEEKVYKNVLHKINNIELLNDGDLE